MHVLSLLVQSDISTSIAGDLVSEYKYYFTSRKRTAHKHAWLYPAMAADTRRAHVSDEYNQIRRCFSLLPTPPQLLISFLSFTRFH